MRWPVRDRASITFSLAELLIIDRESARQVLLAAVRSGSIGLDMACAYAAEIDSDMESEIQTEIELELAAD